MNRHDDPLDRAMRVSGSLHQLGEAHERLQEITAETMAWELVLALQAAVDGAAHWRIDAKALLDKIDECQLPEPR
ncbi:MAG TPA: hypothetical protein VIY51_01800 [Xanthobacteraceae bacterium]